jgi:hypothetical protein
MKHISLLIILVITSSCSLSHTSRKVNGSRTDELILKPLDKRQEIQQAHYMSHQ